MEPGGSLLSEAGILVNADIAKIDRRNFVAYALNPDHESGRHKAAVFNRVLGFDLSNADVLIDLVRSGVRTTAA